MMFKHFKEDSLRGLTEETLKIIRLPREQRKTYITGKFNMILSQAQYPTRIDN